MSKRKYNHSELKSRKHQKHEEEDVDELPSYEFYENMTVPKYPGPTPIQLWLQQYGNPGSSWFLPQWWEEFPEPDEPEKYKPPDTISDTIDVHVDRRTGINLDDYKPLDIQLKGVKRCQRRYRTNGRRTARMSS